MGELAPIHWLIIFVIVGILFVLPVVLYRHGKKVGDLIGYNRGYKEGQQASLIQEAVKRRGE